MWNKTKIIFAVLGSVLTIIASSIVSLLVSKKTQTNTIQSSKKIGESETKDVQREDSIVRAQEQVETNNELIERSRKAIEKARQLRNENNS
jgi:hypothetical protein